MTPSGSESERASMDGMEVERRMSCQGVTPSGSESE